jgi:hypothetical protein
MAKLRSTFLKGVETIFNVFNEAVKTGSYSVVTDDGFNTPSTVTDTVRCIFEKFTAKDVELLTFSDLIQPQDIKGLMPFVDLVNTTITTQGYVLFGTDKYTVEAHDLDPIDVIYTLLLRKI